MTPEDPKLYRVGDLILLDDLPLILKIEVTYHTFLFGCLQPIAFLSVAQSIHTQKAKLSTYILVGIFEILYL